ncbi:MAG: hypothetical protein ACTTKH_07320 [Treponema sp.]
MEKEIIIKDAKKAIEKLPITYNKYNRNEYKSFRLLFSLVLIGLLFAFGCKQNNNGTKQQYEPSNEITITIKGDSNLTVETPYTFKANRNDAWKKIKEVAGKKITAKDNFQIQEW